MLDRNSAQAHISHIKNEICTAKSKKRGGRQWPNGNQQSVVRQCVKGVEVGHGAGEEQCFPLPTDCCCCMVKMRRNMFGCQFHAFHIENHSYFYLSEFYEQLSRKRAKDRAKEGESQ